MFFWVILGSLISLITWGKISENARSADNHVVPVYESMVASLSVQTKLASEYVNSKLKEFDGASVGTHLPQYPSHSGLLFQVDTAGKIPASSNEELADGGSYAKTRYSYIKLASGFKSAFFCVRKNVAEDVVLSTAASDLNLCSLENEDGDSLLMVVTYGQGRGVYSSANLQYFFKAVARAEPGAKNMGVLRRATKTEGVLSEKKEGVDDAETLYWIYSVGVSVDDALYLPKGVVTAIKEQEGLDPTASLDGYFISVEVLRHKGATCLIRNEDC